MIEAARRVTGRAPEPDSTKPSATKDKAKKNVTVSFDPNSLEGFNTEKKSIIKDRTGDADEDKLLKTLFVTNPDAADDFEQEKHDEVEHDLGSKVQRQDIKQGWGEWAGSGVDTSKYDARRAKAD